MYLFAIFFSYLLSNFLRPLLALTLKATAAFDSIAEHYLHFNLLKKYFHTPEMTPHYRAVQSIT